MALKSGRKSSKKSTKGKGKKKSSFKYVERSPESVKKRAEQSSGKYDGYLKEDVDRMQLSKSENVFRILPPTWEGFDHCGYEVFVHSFVGSENGSYLCHSKMLNKNCPICDAAREAKADGDTEDASKLEAKKRVLYYVVDRDDDSPIPKVLDAAWTIDRDIFALTYNNRTGKVKFIVDHPDDGHDIIIKRQGKGLATRYYGHQIEPESSPIDDDDTVQEDILEQIQKRPIPDVLKFHDHDYLERIMSGSSSDEDEDDEDEDEDEDEEEDDRSKKGKKKSSKYDEDDDEDDDDEDDDDDDLDDEDEDEEEEEKPARKKSSGKRGRSGSSKSKGYRKDPDVPGRKGSSKTKPKSSRKKRR